ncbi:hypothetical protein [Bacillus sp. JJ722]|uniref:hypothetical protein n=1 Tax=Bacillus sp. JJ722 TaxID=3122973 RepID=UPI002FFF1F9D
MAQPKRSIELSEIIREMRETNKRISDTAAEMYKQGTLLSHAERNYKVALHHKILELKTAGYPATLILELAKGDEKIAGLRFERDLAKSRLDTAKEGARSLRAIQSTYQTISKYQDEL